MIPIINLSRLSTTWQDNPAYFTRLWNTVMQMIETSINAINDVFNQVAAAQDAANAAQNAADTAQTSADGAQTSADTAQSTAISALSLGVTSVQKDQTTAWAAPTGTVSRASLAGYSAPVISNPPTQAEVQAIANYLQVISQADCALISDLRGNHALHN